jgi:hypothetical protein
MWASEALHAEAQTITPQDLLAFLPRLLKRLHIDVLYHVRVWFPPCVCVVGGGSVSVCVCLSVPVSVSVSVSVWLVIGEGNARV